MTTQFLEIRESRGISLTSSGAETRMVLVVCGDFYSSADSETFYGVSDDKKLLETLYNELPLIRTIPTGFGFDLFLIISSIEASQIAHDTWRVEVSYTTPEQSSNQSINSKAAIGPHTEDYQDWSQNYVQVTVNSRAVTRNRKMSLQVVSCQKSPGAQNQIVPFPAGRPAPIGWTVDGIAGADFYDRVFEFTLTVYKSPEKYSFKYVRKLYRLSTTINNNTFFGFPAGSVLFLGHDASSESYRSVAVNFHFMMQPNFKFKENGPSKMMDPNVDDPAQMYNQYHDPWFPDASGSFPGDTFSGWDYVDYAYAPLPDTGAAMTIQKPILRTIHQLYWPADFSLLEI